MRDLLRMNMKYWIIVASRDHLQCGVAGEHIRNLIDHLSENSAQVYVPIDIEERQFLNLSSKTHLFLQSVLIFQELSRKPDM